MTVIVEQEAVRLNVLRPSAGSMSSGSVIGVTSTVGVSTALPVGRTSIASEEDCPPET